MFAAMMLDCGETLRMLGVYSGRRILASRAGSTGALRPPTTGTIGVVLIDDADDSTASTGPYAFPTLTRAWVRRRASVVVVASPTPPVEAVLALARVLREGHSAALVLTLDGRLAAWRGALHGCRVRYVGHSGDVNA